MALLPGMRLGPYEITGQIGVGGMGEVYRATDTNLKRSVAIKVLPEAVAADPERLARFQREAEVLASLNHPNIAAIYGLERANAAAALVMELVSGEDLSLRIARGAIPLDEALPIAKQIAEALEAAHERGIIHRDLKPANIKVRSDGTVKVLDFGLAKAMEPSGSSPIVSQSPTITTPAITEAGTILGTAAYMSPEQVKAKTVDKRADVWAFGTVLFEMLAGTRPFDGEATTEVLGAILHVDANWAALPSDLPQPIRTLLETCLVKDPGHRLRDISTALFVFEKCASLAAAAEPSAAPPGRGGRRIWMAALVFAAVLIVAMAAPAVRHLHEPEPADRALVRFQIPAPGRTPAEMFRLSPDGRALAFVASDSGGTRLWVHSLDSLEARALPGTGGAIYPFWSPDNQYLGFFAEGKLRKIAAAGGPPLTLCDAANARGGTWNRDGEIVFSAGPVGPLSRVPASGGVPIPATKVGEPNSNESHRFPEFLPDGRHFFYQVQSSLADAGGVYVASLDGGMAPVRILPDTSNAAYAPPSISGRTGLVLFRREETLMAQPFDPKQLRTTGEMFPVAERVAGTGNTGFGAFSVAATGLLAFRAAGGTRRQLAWIDRAGTPGPAVTQPFENPEVGTGYGFALSPDEQRVVFAAVEGNQLDLWMMNLAQGGASRFTFGPGPSVRPIWSPDGRHVVFTRGLLATDLYQMPASGGDAQLLLHVDGVTNIDPLDWSRDGLIVYHVTHQKTASDLWLLSMNEARKPIPYLQTAASETAGQFSPDGRWMAYVSNEFGQNQVFVQSIPASGLKRQISTDGGTAPSWRRDGRELFYVAPDQRLMAVPVKLGANFEAGQPQPLPVIAPDPGATESRGGYARTRDGQRFLVNVPAGGGMAGPPAVTVVLNWQAGLPKR